MLETELNLYDIFNMMNHFETNKTSKPN